MQDVLFDSTIRYDATFFEHLNRIVQAEPWIERDRAMIDPLRTLGIEKGKPFKPDAETRATLDAAAVEAKASSTRSTTTAGARSSRAPTGGRRRRRRSPTRPRQASPSPTPTRPTCAA